MSGGAVAGSASQLIINTVTSIVTFLLVALLQISQRRSEEAINAKLNALAEGQADIMRYLMGDDFDLHDDIVELKTSVGLEQRITTAEVEER